MNEPDVTITDFILGIENGLFCLLLLRGANPKKFWWAVFFLFMSVAAILGGMVHGYFPDKTTITHEVLWKAILLSLGIVAFSMLRISSELLKLVKSLKLFNLVSGLILLAYCVVVILVSQEFKIAIYFYLPAVLLWGYCFTYSHKQSKDSIYILGIIGLGLTLAGAVLQQFKVGIHPEYFNHNAVYHVVTFIAQAIIFLTAKKHLKN